MNNGLQGKFVADVTDVVVVADVTDVGVPCVPDVVSFADVMKVVNIFI